MCDSFGTTGEPHCGCEKGGFVMRNGGRFQCQSESYHTENFSFNYYSFNKTNVMKRKIKLSCQIDLFIAIVMMHWQKLQCCGFELFLAT